MRFEGILYIFMIPFSSSISELTTENIVYYDLSKEKLLEGYQESSRESVKLLEFSKTEKEW